MIMDIKKFTNEELLSEVGRRLDNSQNVTELQDTFVPFTTTIPGAKKDTSNGNMRGRGRYATSSGNPEGIIVHFVANRYSFSASSYHGWMIGAGLTALYIDGEGQLWQNMALDQWGHHAGTSKCPATNRTSVSKYYIGVEIACPGKLTPNDDGTYEAWFGKKYSSDQVRYVKSSDGYVHTGYYAKYTPEQEKTLLDMCVNLVKNYDMDTRLILGHDEVAPSRKNDPGGSLSMTMEDFRSKVKSNL